MARIGLLQLEQKKYALENIFKKDSLYVDQILLMPIVWNLKHSIELLIKCLDIRITGEFAAVHDIKMLQSEIKKAFKKLKINDSKLLKDFIRLSRKYFQLKVLPPSVVSAGRIRDFKNDILRYPNDKLNMGKFYKVSTKRLLGISDDINGLNRLSLKIYSEITKAKIGVEEIFIN